MASYRQKKQRAKIVKLAVVAAVGIFAFPHIKNAVQNLTAKLAAK
jgi:hypothetical protein